MIAVVLLYFAVLFAISRWTARRATNETFYRADRRSPWWLVAFGMVGASISGVTFVSVPGMVTATQMTYLQTCLGFIVGYVVVAFVLLPLYYRLNLTSIYSYLGRRLGRRSYRTGAWFFLLSKMAGAAVKFYVVCMVMAGGLGLSGDGHDLAFSVIAVGLVSLIWLYTRRGGIRTLVFTDTFQTVCLLAALLLIIYKVVGVLGMTPSAAVSAVAASPMSRVVVLDDWLTTQNFWKQFVSGAFIVVVMTGLDQDMMQKNLTCRTLRDAQKDMCTYGLAFVPVNLLFLSLGVLLTMVPSLHGVRGDALLTTFVFQASSAGVVPVLFTIGIVAASFSSADSALTSLTTCYCVDICQRPDDERLRKRTHVLMCVVFVLFILLFRLVNSTSLIDAVYILVSYTYGPLLGLFAFGLFTARRVNDRVVPCVAVTAPVLCYVADALSTRYLAYHFGYELLMLNGLLTFMGLWLTQKTGSGSQG